MKSRKLLAVICRNPLHFDFAGALVSPHVASGFAFLLTKQQFFCAGVRRSLFRSYRVAVCWKWLSSPRGVTNTT